MHNAQPDMSSVGLPGSHPCKALCSTSRTGPASCLAGRARCGCGAGALVRSRHVLITELHREGRSDSVCAEPLAHAALSELHAATDGHNAGMIDAAYTDYTGEAVLSYIPLSNM